MLRCRQANHKLRLQGQGRQNRQPRQVLFLVAMRRTVNTSNFGPEVVNVKVKVDEKSGGLVVLDGYLQYLTNSNVDLCRGRLCLRSAVHPRSRLSRADGCQMVVGRQRALWRHLFFRTVSGLVLSRCSQNQMSRRTGTGTSIQTEPLTNAPPRWSTTFMWYVTGTITSEASSSVIA